MAQDSQTTGLIFDFAYIDKDRVSSYFSQLFPNGVLSTIKTSNSDQEQYKQDMQVSAAVFKTVTEDNQSTSETVERHYDTAWTLPVTLLNKLDEMGFLHRAPIDCPIGQAILVSGAMQILDIRMLRDMWKPIMEMMHLQNEGGSGNRHARRGSQRQDNQKSQHDAVLGALQHLPHTLQMSFISDNDAFLWSTLRSDSMVIAPEDFSLKFGSAVPGKWHMLAILDGRPDISADHLSAEFRDRAGGGPGISTAMMDLLGSVREIFGRPDQAYAVTPLMVFRSIRPEIAVE